MQLPMQVRSEQQTCKYRPNLIPGQVCRSPTGLYVLAHQPAVGECPSAPAGACRGDAPRNGGSPSCWTTVRLLVRRNGGRVSARSATVAAMKRWAVLEHTNSAVRRSSKVVGKGKGTPEEIEAARAVLSNYRLAHA